MEARDARHARPRWRGGLGIAEPRRPHARDRGGFRRVVRLWDLPTQREVGAPLPGVPGRLTVPQFTPDGRSLLAITDAGRAYLWDVRPSRWMRQACDVAGRTLTRTEWQDALPGRDYAPACRR